MTRTTRMTEMDDIKGILNEQATDAVESQALELTVARLEQVLSKDVSYRPAFKAELRNRLLTQARPKQVPWYGRVSIWGSGLGLVAAVAVLVVGLPLLQGGMVVPFGTMEPPPGITALPPETPEIVDGPQIALVPRLTNQLNLAVPEIPDEILPAAGHEINGDSPDVTQGLRVYTLTARPNEEQFTDLAVRIGVSAMIQPIDRGFQAISEHRTLQMTVDGLVQFEDRSSVAAASEMVVDPAAARLIARRFLDRAALPVPDLQPAVHEERSDSGGFSFTVSYSPRVDRMPIVNGRTMIRVTSQGQVERAEAFVASGHQTTIPYAVIAKEDAIRIATERGGFIKSDQVSDLVLVRTLSDQTVHLQPYWRIFGQTGTGVKIARYVPALIR